MPLLNYTTSVEAEKTVAEIQRILARAGADQVMLSFADGAPSAIAFRVATAAGVRGFRLPANLGAIEKTLQKQRRAGKLPPRYATKEQAARVGWRILKDWVEAQLALIETGMASLDEVMLPYLLIDGQTTAYQALAARGMALPGPEDRKPHP